jgi:hypothetical protein
MKCSCGKEYKRLKPFQIHRATCELLALSKTSKQDTTHLFDVPSQLDMWLALKTALKQIDSLKTKVEQQDRWIKRQRKKLSVIDWLNDNCKAEKNYIEFYKSIELTPKDLKLIFDHNFINGMYYILQKYLNPNNNTNLPIRAFEQKLNVLFVYTGDTWEMLDSDDFTKLINAIHKKVHTLFMNWYKKQGQLDYGDIDESYYKNITKVMGGSKPMDFSVKKINFKLYNYLKFNLKNVVKYEFTF